jgi:hypothetical protein
MVGFNSYKKVLTVQNGPVFNGHSKTELFGPDLKWLKQDGSQKRPGVTGRN